MTLLKPVLYNLHPEGISHLQRPRLIFYSPHQSVMALSSDITLLIMWYHRGFEMCFLFTPYRLRVCYNLSCKVDLKRP